MTKERLMRLIPTRYQEDPVMNNIMQANGTEFDLLLERLEDLAKQRFVQTATWGINEWENLVALPHTEQYTIEQRRSRVLAKLMMANTITRFRMNEIVKRFISNSYIVENISDYSIKVVITEWELAVKALYETLEEIRPAHLGLTIEFKTNLDIFVAFYNKTLERERVRFDELGGTIESRISIAFLSKEASRIKILQPILTF